MRDAVDIWMKFAKFLLKYLILKFVFHLQIFSYEPTFFGRKLRKKLLTNENSAIHSSSSILLRYFCVLFTPIHEAKQNIFSDIQM